MSTTLRTLAGLVALVVLPATTLAQTSQEEGKIDQELDLGGEEIVVEARRTAKPGQVLLDARDAEEVAGVQGDALKALGKEAGVARSSASQSGLSVWGAAPAETQIYVDDMPVPRLFHLGGARSILPSSEIARFELIAGGAGARYGRGIGAAVSIETSDEQPTQPSMRLRMDPVDLGAQIASPIGRRGRLSFAARSSLLKPSVALVAPKRAEELFAIPDYGDYQLRSSHRLADGQRLQIVGLISGDHLERGIPSLNPDQGFQERRDAGFERLGITLRRKQETRDRRLTLWIGRDQEAQNLDYGQIVANSSLRSYSMGTLLTQEHAIDESVQLTIGVDAQLTRSAWSRDGALTLPAREGDIGVFGQEPGNRVNRDDWRVTQASAGLFASARIRAMPSLEIEPGLRLEPSVINGDRVLPVRPSEPEVGYTELQWALDPRVSARYLVGTRGTLFAALGQYHQPPAASDLSPVFGSPILTQSSAYQALLGYSLQANSWMQIEVQGFGALQGELATRAPSATPAIASLLESSGEGRVFGAQLSTRLQPTETFSASLNYTLMKAERRSAGEAWRAFDADQRHMLRSAAQWTTAMGLSLAARLELSSGFPRTPVVGAIFNAGSQHYDPIFGAHNAERLPLYGELSLRAGYDAEESWGSYRVWLDVVNVSNRANVEELYYTSDFMQRGYVRGLPILPLLGAELRI